MATREEFRVFRRFLKTRGLKQTRQREEVLRVFLAHEKHFTAEDLYREVRRESPDVSQATVFRTLKLLARAGLARTLRLDDRIIRYEHGYGHGHHDHLICEACGRIIETVAPPLEALQEEMCRAKGFLPRYHRLKIFGTCAACLERASRPAAQEGGVSMTLRDLKPGEKGKIKGMKGGERVTRRLMDMGVTPGAVVTVERVAPLGDPYEINVRGYHLSLRLAEVRLIEVEKQ